jgi:hypothetical protein
MKVILRLEMDSGIEISSLVLPVAQRDYLTLSAEALAKRYITPYLANLTTDELVWERICRTAQSDIGRRFGPA